jgi:CRP-like cAMP-binding protein
VRCRPLCLFLVYNPRVISDERARTPEADDLQGLIAVLADAFPASASATRTTLQQRADVLSFRAGDTVVAQGDESGIVLVLEGMVGFRRTTIDGREVIPRVASRGQLAPMMPIAGRPAVAEAVALSSCRVARWTGSGLRALADEDAGFAVDLLDQVLLTYETIVEGLDGLLHQDASRRVARVLELHADALFGEAAPLTRAFLPALVGTSREMTGRVLRQLESDGVLARVGRDRLRLLDPARLARTATAASTSRGPRNKFLAARGRAMQE